MCIDTIYLWLMCYIYVDIVSIYMYIHIYVLLLGKNHVSRKVRDSEKLSSTNVEKSAFYKCRISSLHLSNFTNVEFYTCRNSTFVELDICKTSAHKKAGINPACVQWRFINRSPHAQKLNRPPRTTRYIAHNETATETGSNTKAHKSNSAQNTVISKSPPSSIYRRVNRKIQAHKMLRVRLRRLNSSWRS